MAEFSIDKNNLPGVKEVCRDFAVLEDHCLAHNLQEQEIESHLASNIHKSRLVQQDLQVAKKLQEEEDQRAKAQSQRQHRDLERQDNEIAQEIQEQLVRQAEKQRQQEEKDAAIARKLQEKEMKEERRRQKQLEANFEEYYEDHGAARRPLDLDKDRSYGSGSPGRHDTYAPGSSHRDYSPDYSSSEPKRSRYPRQDPAAPHSRSRYPEHSLVAEGGRSRHADPYPEHLLPSRGKHGDRYPDYQTTETSRTKGQRGEDGERVVRRKERPARPPPPHSPKERDKALDWERGYERDKNRDRERNRYRDRERGREPEWDRDLRKDQWRSREQEARQERGGGRDRERSRDRGLSGDRQRERDRQRHKDRDRQQARTRSRERGLEEDLEPVPSHSRDWLREDRAEEDYDGERERRARGRQRVHSGPEEVFDEHRSDEGRGETRELWDSQQGEGPGRERSHTDPTKETGRIAPRGGGTAVAGGEYGLNEATQGLTRLDLREQELRDMEVARKMQEEEIKASKMDKRAAQVAQDEEIARLMMEQEKKEFKRKEREREKDREREKERLAMERMAMERKRPEGDYRPNSEEVVRPRSQEPYEYQRQRNHNKPARPPQPRAHDYENVNSSSGYGCSDNPFSPRAPSRPEAAYKGAYYRQ